MSISLKRVAQRLACSLTAVCAALAVIAPVSAFAATPASGTGWGDVNGATRWYDNGVMATSKFFYDPGTDGWYWAESDGSIAANHDAFVPLDNTVAGKAWETASDAWRAANGKWVRLGSDGKMIKGEDCRYGGWYWFDPTTGAMTKGFVFVPSNGGKWVFYDYTTGQMAHGERFIDSSHGDEAGWMYFDDVTGAVTYGWKDLPGKTVYYNTTSGRMVYGRQVIGGVEYYFDTATGALLSQQPSEPQQPSNPDATETVYVTASGNGEKYHTRDCTALKRSHNVIGMSVSEALAAGYTACNLCHP